MPLLSLPNELVAKILRFVTPPLPVPTSTTSFLPEVLEQRGDNEGEWQDIGSLRFVSKAMKDHAAPFFWSHIEVINELSADRYVRIFEEQPKLTKLVRSVRYSGTSEETSRSLRGESPLYFALITWLSHDIQHISFRRPYPVDIERILTMLAAMTHKSLVGLHGLPLSISTLAPIHLLLFTHHKNLLHLSLVQTADAESSFNGQYTDKLRLPALLTLSVDAQEMDKYLLSSNWVEQVLDCLWVRPSLVKFGIMRPRARPRPSPVWHWKNHIDAPCSAHDGIGALLQDWARGTEDDCLEEVTCTLPGMGLDGVVVDELELAPLVSLKRIIIVQKALFQQAGDHAQIVDALAAIVGPALLPALREVFWVLPKGISHREVLWSGALVQWMRGLERSSINLRVI